MYHAFSQIRRACSAAKGVASACALAMMLAAPTSADDIDLSLNVFYSNPSNANSGGTWEVVARTDVFGLSGLQMYLTDIATASSAGPRGFVNGTDPAGLGIFFADPEPGLGFTEIVVGQALLFPDELGPTEEQSVFYGIGALQNGAPNYPGKPLGTNSIGPLFTSLSNVQNVPWATGDAFGDGTWSTGARVAFGTFNPGDRPGFLQSPTLTHSGTVFTTEGTNKVYGQLSGTLVASTIVRTNLAALLLPDYNRNGVVDAADFVLWRKTNNQVGAGLVADGNNDGRVDQADYDLWRMHFGALVGPGASAGAGGNLSTNGVPEPASSALLALGAALVAARRRFVDRAPRSARTAG